MMMKFESLDSRIRYVHLEMRRDLESIPHFELPNGFRYVFYKVGDRDAWIDIESSAGEFSTYEGGLKNWNIYFGGRDDILSDRMIFVEDAFGNKDATCTAYYDVTGKDTSPDGWMHWMGIKKEFQGRGLAKPLFTRAMRQMKSLGYTHCKIPTQCNSWLACKVYLDLGFRPTEESRVNGKDGWRIVKALTNHPALAEFTPATMEEILK